MVDHDTGIALAELGAIFFKETLIFTLRVYLTLLSSLLNNFVVLFIAPWFDLALPVDYPCEYLLYMIAHFRAIQLISIHVFYYLSFGVPYLFHLRKRLLSLLLA